MNNEQRSIHVSAAPASNGSRPGKEAARPSPPAGAITPAIDIHENADGLILEADLPGANESSLRVELEHNVLNLHASVTRALPETARAVHQESGVAEYFRSFILSDEVQRDEIRAELKNGVLRLTLPRAEREAPPHRRQGFVTPCLPSTFTRRWNAWRKRSKLSAEIVSGALRRIVLP